MTENSAIEWTDHTFNPWWGCARVSPACQHCYAETLAKRFGTEWGKTADRKFFGDKHWNEPLRWDRSAAKAGVRKRVFCASMADVFEDRPELAEHRDRLWKLIEATPHLDWLLLTKRPENVLAMTPWAWRVGQHTDPPHTEDRRHWPANAWVGTTVENQRYADERIPELTRIPAPVLFLSCEPLLEPLELGRWLGLGYSGLVSTEVSIRPAIGWVIAGGESGSGARPMHPEWVRHIRDQAAAGGVPFLFKQWGEWLPGMAEAGVMGPLNLDGTDEPRAESITVSRVGKKVAGRLLDGRTYDGLPHCPADTNGDGDCGRQNCPHCDWRRP